MAEDYGHFAVGSSGGVADRHGSGVGAAAVPSYFGWNQLTPSFFCRLEDEVVYWNTSRLSG
jgi:hypothetical protein